MTILASKRQYWFDIVNICLYNVILIRQASISFPFNANSNTTDSGDRLELMGPYYPSAHTRFPAKRDKLRQS